MNAETQMYQTQPNATNDPERALKAVNPGHGLSLTRKMRARHRIWTHPSSNCHLRLLHGIGPQRWETRPTGTKTHRSHRESLTYRRSYDGGIANVSVKANGQMNCLSEVAS